MFRKTVKLRRPQKNKLLLGWISNAIVMIKKKKLFNKGFAPNVLLEATKYGKG
jgi:hypothetical protein